MHRLLPIVFTLIFPLLVLSCKKEAPAVDPSFSACEHAVDNRHNRTIGYDILDATESGDFGANYAIASEQLHGEFIQLLQPWNAFEDTQAGVYDGEAMQLFETLNSFAAAVGTQLSLIITPIDIPGRFMPAHLSGKKFDDPLVIESFNHLIDRLFNPDSGIVDPSRVIALSVGNEVDHYNWTANGDQPDAYKSFLQGIKPKVNSYGIPLHFTGTLYGMRQPGNPWLDLADVVDRVSITYYPLHADFTVKSQDAVYADFDAFFTTFKDYSIFVQEVGYPSSAALNSSEEKQAEFFCNFFDAWDCYKDQVPYVSILRLNDVSLAAAQATAVTYGIPGNEKFIAYIRTLGLRTWPNTGTDKKGFDVIAGELDRRNW